jgi:hypothetical protein
VKERKEKRKKRTIEKEVGNRKQYYNMEVIEGSQEIYRCVEPLTKV